MKKYVGEDTVGVSPVIAVILMVAITVVLAGVVYVWVSSFSSDSDNRLSYVGYDIKSVDTDWVITIGKVQGASLPFDGIQFIISDVNGVNIYTKTVHDMNPYAFAKDESLVYPIAENNSAVVSSATGLPVTVNDDYNDYEGAILVLIDIDNNYALSTGDSIRLFSDVNGDGDDEINMGNHFKIVNLSGAHNYLEVVL